MDFIEQIILALNIYHLHDGVFGYIIGFRFIGYSRIDESTDADFRNDPRMAARPRSK